MFQRTKWLRLLVIIGALLTGPASRANKFDLSAGYYSLTAKTSSASGNSAGLGGYKLTYSFDLFRGLQLALGYSLIMSNTVGGDLGYGLDLGFEYFFLTPPQSVQGSSPSAFMSVSPLWRPFVGTSFHQRQFQSVRTNYAGFGVSAGVERSLDAPFDAKAQIRYSALTGPGSSTATELMALLGLVYTF